MSIDTRIPQNILDAHAERVAAERDRRPIPAIPATSNPDAPIPFVPVKPPTRAQALRRIMRILDKLDTDDDRTAVLDALSLLWGPR